MDQKLSSNKDSNFFRNAQDLFSEFHKKAADTLKPSPDTLIFMGNSEQDNCVYINGTGTGILYLLNRLYASILKYKIADASFLRNHLEKTLEIYEKRQKEKDQLNG